MPRIGVFTLPTLLLLLLRGVIEGSDVPAFDGAVQAAADHLRAVPRKGDAVDAVRVPLELPDERPGLYVPDTNHVVKRGGRDQFTVWGNGEGRDGPVAGGLGVKFIFIFIVFHGCGRVASGK